LHNIPCTHLGSSQSSHWVNKITRLLKSKTVLISPCRRQGERKYSSYSLNLDTGWNELSASRSGHTLSAGKNPSSHFIGGWVGLRAGLDTEAGEKNIFLCRDRNPVVQSVVRHYTGWAALY
jgi:hypothetical protein